MQQRDTVGGRTWRVAPRDLLTDLGYFFYRSDVEVKDQKSFNPYRTRQTEGSLF